VTVILTTHYIEEAEEMADRIGVISKGRLILVEDKVELMHKLGKKQLKLQLQQPWAAVPAMLAGHALELAADGLTLTYTYDTRNEPAQGAGSGIAALLQDLGAAGVTYTDLQTSQSSLEDIFVSLVHR
jgi:ABC-2 type transport system ATP-binding protein